VGKDTIADSLTHYKTLNLKRIPTYTTRPPRQGEKSKNRYHFVSKNKFQKLMKQNLILESNFYNQHYYGTPKKELEDALWKAKNALLVVDVHGGVNLKKIYPDACLIFIKSPLVDIQGRLEKRSTNTPKQIEERLKTAENELKYQKCYNYVVENPEGHPERAIQEIKKIIVREVKCM